MVTEYSLQYYVEKLPIRSDDHILSSTLEHPRIEHTLGLLRNLITHYA